MIEYYLGLYICYLIKYGLIVSPIILLSQIGSKSKKLFRNCNLINRDEQTPLIYSKKYTEYGHYYNIHIPDGLSPDDFMQKQLALETALNCRIELIPSTNRIIVMKCYTKNLSNIYNFTPIFTDGLDFPLGISRKGMTSIKLDDEFPHMLIAGGTGSGKSVCLRSIITNIILTKTPDEIELHLCDLKGGIEFAIFKNSSFITSYAKSLDDAIALLESVKAEMYRRLTVFETHKVVNLSQYNKKCKDNMYKHIVVIMDEVANITLNSKYAVELIDELHRLARAVGIHLIMATQRPDKDVVPGSIKANIGATVAFKVRNRVNSQILLDHDGAELLKGKGHGILQAGDEIEFQGYFLSPEQAEKLIAHTNIKHIASTKKANVSGVKKRAH